MDLARRARPPASVHEDRLFSVQGRLPTPGSTYVEIAMKAPQCCI